MKLLIDVQLPPQLVRWFKERGTDAIHAADLENGLRLPDIKLWQIAKENDWLIATKDMDFFELSAVHGAQPKVLILRYGNCANETMLTYLSEVWPKLEKRFSDDDVRLILLGRESMEIYRS